MYKKNISKVMALFLSLVMLTGVIAGCSKEASDETTPSGNADATTTTATEATTEAVTEVAALEPVELTWYMDGTPQDDLDTVMVEVNKILKEKINATLKLNIIDWGSFDDKMKILLSSGEPIDLCFTSSWANDYIQNAGKGAFLAMDDLLQQYAKPYFDSIPQKYWDSVKMNGKIYAGINYQITYYENAIFFKKDIVDKYNIDLSNIKTVRDLEPIFEMIMKNEPDMIPLLATDTTSVGAPYNDLVMGWKYDGNVGVPSSGLDRQANDFKVINTLDAPEVFEYYNTLRDFYLKGYIAKDAASMKDERAEASTGKYFAFAQSYKPGCEIDMKSRVGYDVVAVPIMKKQAGAQTGTMTAIPISSKNPERAMMLLNLVNTDKELYNLLCHGIEGVHYTKIDDVTIKPTENAGYAPNLDWEFGNQFNGFFREGQPSTIWEETLIANDEAELSSLIGFVLNTEPIKSELAQMSSVYDTYMAGLMTGSIDTRETLDKMNAEYKAAGMDKVYAEAQKQIDTWRAANNK